MQQHFEVYIYRNEGDLGAVLSGFWCQVDLAGLKGLIFFVQIRLHDSFVCISFLLAKAFFFISSIDLRIVVIRST